MKGNLRIKSEYQRISKKYNLPLFEKIDNEFEVSTIENESFLVREIRRKIIERIEYLIRLFDELIQPSAESYIQLYECRVFNDEEKKEIHYLYKKLLSFDRESLMIGLQTDDKKEADFINRVFIWWTAEKERIMKIINKLREGWETEATGDEEAAYFG